MIRYAIDRVIYEFRWWRWFLSAPPADSKLPLDVWERELDAHDTREPLFRGQYPHRLKAK